MSHLVVSACLLFLVCVSSLDAQPAPPMARWRSVDFGTSTGFPEDTDYFRTIWFRDSLYGVVQNQNGQPYLTIDGGATWERTTVPWPQRLLWEGFGVAEGGFVTNDTGRTWERYRSPADTTVVIDAILSTNRRFIVSSGWTSGVRTLIYTTDSGRSWTIIKHNGGGDNTGASSRDTADIRQIPFPFIEYPGDRLYVTLHTPIGICNDSIIYLQSSIHITRRDWSQEEATYLWRYDLVTGHASWRRDVAAAEMKTLCFVEQPIVFTSPHSESNSIDWTGNRVFPIGFAVDSSTLFLAGPYSFVARSTDRGLTWRSNDAASRALCIVADRDRILVGRDYGSMMRSTDRGRTWIDIGKLGWLPVGVGPILAMTQVDRKRSPDHIVAHCRMILAPYGALDGRFIESHDFGRTWALMPFESGNMRFSSFAHPFQLFAFGAEGAITRMIANVEYGVAFSGDGGRTWSGPEGRSAPNMSMSDSLHGFRVTDTYRAGGRTNQSILRTQDGGRTWVIARDSFLVDIGYGSWMLGCNASSPSHFSVLRKHSSNARMRTWTTDGGATWTDEQVGGAREPFGAAKWIDSANIVMIGSGGFLEVSTDAGVTWRVASDRDWSFKAPGVTAYADSMYMHFADRNVGEIFDFKSERSSTQSEAGARTIRITSANDGRALHIESSCAELRVSVVDVVGRVHMARALTERSDHTLRLDDLPIGTYLCRVSGCGASRVVAVRAGGAR